MNSASYPLIDLMKHSYNPEHGKQYMRYNMEMNRSNKFQLILLILHLAFY